MPPSGKQGGGKATDSRKKFLKQLNKRSAQEADEIAKLEEAIKAAAPPRGTNPLAKDASGSTAAPESGAAAAALTTSTARGFDDIPISQYTKDALRSGKFVSMTAIQRAALPHMLAGRDVLGAAKTGSGKTLTFLIPVVEKLYRARWTRHDGLGGLVLTPTRELAVQIFEELRKIGKNHELSAGLLIGGKNVKEEQASINTMNILVATPGRLLQHMDETPGFDCSTLQMLVLDEADRILDMGFAATLDAIIANLPREGRQTALFSATQTKSVRDLARLSLRDPEYISVHAEAVTATPLKLQQAWADVGADRKMDVLWSFIKTHLQAKTIVFLSTCKQVRFFHEAFRKLRPGVPLRALHGGMKQMKRMTVFYEFCKAKASVLFATDIAARGLDFPTVDWVVQADCPEDVAAYIHRVGRTARYTASGRALLMLAPSEKEGMLAALAESKVPIKQIKLNPDRTQPVTPALQALLSKNVELKEFAQRALVAYCRSVFLQPNKKVFNVASLPVVEMAQSWGLLTAPKLRFLKKVGKKTVAVEVGGTTANGGLGEDEEMEEQGQDQAAPAAAAAATAAASKGKKGAAAAADAGVPASAKAASKDAAAGKAAAAAAAAAPAKDEEEDFMVVKQRDVFSSLQKKKGKAGSSEGGSDAADDDEGEDDAAGSGDGEEEGSEDDDGDALRARGASSMDAEPGPGSAKNQKKKKIKIKVGKLSGQRTVFDESGNAVDPLQLLASTQLGEGEEQGADDGAVDRDGVYIVRDKPEDRFRAAQALMRKRDAEDKARMKEIRAAMKAELKAKRKAREAGEGGAVVTLGQAGSDDDDGSSDDGSDDYGSSGSESEGEERQARRRGARAGGSSSDDHDDDDLLLTSDSEGEGDSDDDEDGGAKAGRKRQHQQQEERAQAGKRQKRQQQPEVAHMGMARKQQAATPAKIDGLSLAEQEAMALQMLRGR